MSKLSTIFLVSLIASNINSHSFILSFAEYYIHDAVKHREGVYVNQKTHVNTIEGFWSLLKRQILGIHHNVSPKHLQRYTDESAFRYNQRRLPQDQKFQSAINRCNGRLKFKELTK